MRLFIYIYCRECTEDQGHVYLSVVPGRVAKNNYKWSKKFWSWPQQHITFISCWDFSNRGWQSIQNLFPSLESRKYREEKQKTSSNCFMDLEWGLYKECSRKIRKLNESSFLKTWKWHHRMPPNSTYPFATAGEPQCSGAALPQPDYHSLEACLEVCDLTPEFLLVWSEVRMYSQL